MYQLTKWDLRFLKLAKEVSTWSKDPSTQTGAVFVDHHRHVVSLGYNGFPARMKDDVELYNNREEKYSRIVHCEMNALLAAPTGVWGTALYTWPFLSCDRCAVHMISAGVHTLIAPAPTVEQAPRWAASFEKTKKYCEEAGVIVQEIPRDQIPFA